MSHENGSFNDSSTFQTLERLQMKVFTLEKIGGDEQRYCFHGAFPWQKRMINNLKVIIPSLHTQARSVDMGKQVRPIQERERLGY